MTGTPNRVTEPQGLLLPRVGDLPRPAQQRGDVLQLAGLAALGQGGLELPHMIEMILDRPLAPAGHEDQILDSRRPRLLGRVLDKRFINYRKHFLRQSLGRREKTGSQAADRKYRLTYGSRRRGTGHDRTLIRTR